MPRRSIDTGIWSEPPFCDLGPLAKLVFLRLWAGDDTRPGGVVRAPARRLAADLSLTVEQTQDALAEVLATELVEQHDGGWLWMSRWIREQVSGPAFAKAVRAVAKEMPPALAAAMGAALDAHAPKREQTESDEKPAKSRGKRRSPDPHLTDTRPSPDSNGTLARGSPDGHLRDDRGSGDPLGGGSGPGQTSGLSVLVGASASAGALAPTREDVDPEPGRRASREDLAAIAEQVGGTVGAAMLRSLAATTGDAGEGRPPRVVLERAVATAERSSTAVPEQPEVPSQKPCSRCAKPLVAGASWSLCDGCAEAGALTAGVA